MSETNVGSAEMDAVFGADSRFLLRKVDIRELSDEAHAEYLIYNNRIRAESHPDDPPRTLEDQMSNWRNIPPIVTIHSWEVRDQSFPGNPIVARGELNVGHQQTNQHLAGFYITVLPERRRDGLARRILRPIAETARENERTLLTAGSNDRVPSGEAFLQALGAERGLESHTNQLVLADLDRAFLTEYREESLRRGSARFRLERCASPFPEELFEPVAVLANRISNDIPHGDLQMEPYHISADEIREMDRTAIAAGMKSMVLVAFDSTDTPAGMTMMTWNSHAPYMTQQGITGVLPEYRGCGLARCLKATLLEQLLEEHPEVRFVRTDNADSNAGMLAINRALGFRPYRSETTWQLPTEQALAYSVA